MGNKTSHANEANKLLRLAKIPPEVNLGKPEGWPFPPALSALVTGSLSEALVPELTQGRPWDSLDRSRRSNSGQVAGCLYRLLW